MKALLPEASEFSALRKMPEGIITAIAGAGYPDTAGLCGSNKSLGWISVAFQRTAMFTLVVDAMRANKTGAEKAWKAIDAAFAKQNTNGSFKVGTYKGYTPGLEEQISGGSFWLAELSRALLAVKASSLSGQFKARIDAIMPSIKKAYRWLANSRQTLTSYDATTVNRLFYDAQAFGLGGLLLNNATYKSYGRTYLRAGLALQALEGYFQELGGHDASYNGTSLLHLSIYALHFPNSGLDTALDKSAAWELSRILPSGDVDRTGDTRANETLLGKPKVTNYAEVGLSLLYSYARTNNAAYLDAANKIYAFVTK